MSSDGPPHPPAAPGWTIDELAQRVTRTLAEQGVQAPSGRVTAVPDRRLIRWYATIGLLDRPLRTRGRVARYGERHLLQLVAVKRRQAQGRSLAEIQAELTGATDTTLRRAAGLPDHPGNSDSGSWSLDAPTGSADDHDRDGFWLATPTTSPVLRLPADHGQPFHASVLAARTRHLPGAPPQTARSPVRPVFPVPLHDAATLVLHAAPTPDDIAAMRAAARPLLDLLAARGLLPETVDPIHEPQPEPGPTHRPQTTPPTHQPHAETGPRTDTIHTPPAGPSSGPPSNPDHEPGTPTIHPPHAGTTGEPQTRPSPQPRRPR